jgi:hypothetical protein
MEYVEVTWATRSAAPSDRMATSPTAKRLPSFINFASARHRPDGGEHRDVHGAVRERHHGRPRYGAARANEVEPVGLPHQRTAMPDLLDRNATRRIEDLGKFAAQKMLQLADRKRGGTALCCIGHRGLAQSPAIGGSIGCVDKVTGRRIATAAVDSDADFPLFSC